MATPQQEQARLHLQQLADVPFGPEEVRLWDRGKRTWVQWVKPVAELERTVAKCAPGTTVTVARVDLQKFTVEHYQLKGGGNV